MKLLSKREIEDIAMAIVNYTNETNGVDVKTRQANNDKCIDWAIDKITKIIIGPDISHLVNESPLQKLMKEQIQNYEVSKR